MESIIKKVAKEKEWDNDTLTSNLAELCDDVMNCVQAQKEEYGALEYIKQTKALCNMSSSTLPGLQAANLWIRSNNILNRAMMALTSMPAGEEIMKRVADVIGASQEDGTAVGVVEACHGNIRETMACMKAAITTMDGIHDRVKIDIGKIPQIICFENCHHTHEDCQSAMG